MLDNHIPGGGVVCVWGGGGEVVVKSLKRKGKTTQCIYFVTMEIDISDIFVRPILYKHIFVTIDKKY